MKQRPAKAQEDCPRWGAEVAPLAAPGIAQAPGEECNSQRGKRRSRLTLVTTGSARLAPTRVRFPTLPWCYDMPRGMHARAARSDGCGVSGVFFREGSKKGWPGMTQPKAPSPCRARAEWCETRGGLDHPWNDSATKPGNARLFATTCSQPCRGREGTQSLRTPSIRPSVGRKPQ